MPKYNPIFESIWDDPDFSDYSPEEKLVFLYVCTNPATTTSGIYQISLRKIANETGLTSDIVQKIFSNGHFKNISYTNEDKFIFIKNRYKYYKVIGGKPSLIKQAVLKEYELTKACSHWLAFIEKYPEFKDSLTLQEPLPNLTEILDTTLKKDKDKVKSTFYNITSHNIASHNKERYLINNTERRGQETEVSAPLKDLREKLNPEMGLKIRQVFAGLDKFRNDYRPTKRKGEAAAILRMLKTYTPDQILDTWAKMKQEKFYADKELFMMTVESQIGAKIKGSTLKAKVPTVKYRPVN